MSIRELKRWQRIAERFSFDHCPIPIRLVVRPAEHMDAIEVIASFQSPDHETGEPHRLWMMEIVSEKHLGIDDEAVKRFIAHLVKRGWEHEIREFTRFDGEVYDSPHWNEATP